MKIVKQIVAILVVSFIGGLGFNAFSPHGIDILGNPWSKPKCDDPTFQNQIANGEPIIFVGLDRACQFIENQEGIVLDARSPEEYAEGHIPGAQLLFFYNLNEYYAKLEDQLKECPVMLVYCGDINCDDSEFLANELFNLGHAPILVYKGGFEEWKSQNLLVERGGKGDEH